MQAVLEGDQIPFEIRPTQRRAAVRTVRADGQVNLVHFFSKCRQMMDLCWPGYACSPDFQLFFDGYREHLFGHLGLGDSPLHMLPNGMLAAEVFNDFILHLRKEAVARKVKKAMWSTRKEGLKYQGQTIDQWIRFGMPSDCAVLPFRVELLFPETALVEAEKVPRVSWRYSAAGQWVLGPCTEPSLNGSAEYRSRIDVRAAFQDREAFFGNRRGADAELFDAVPTYLCKAERGDEFGALHFHVVLMVDIRKRRSLEWILDRASARWARITGGRGYVFNSNTMSDRASLQAKGLWALDVLTPGDTTQRDKLQRYITGYFAKDEQGLSVKPAERSRTLTKGSLLK
ncbi:hypothetical protein ACS7SF_08475 [Ralstonia sp. 25C]|uniref:hypothetical protein n=1 Tax=Ralstonia sp. 25C TaxID=3447363 RepID=UPI003F750B05